MKAEQLVMMGGIYANATAQVAFGLAASKNAIHTVLDSCNPKSKHAFEQL